MSGPDCFERNIFWRCYQCGRKLAQVRLAPGDDSLIEIVCPRCRERNVFDCLWDYPLKAPVETYTRPPTRF